ncbi:MAG: sugar phosphate isomerase/epimerase, partial [Chthoniobacteraceae bacterium]
AHVKNFVARSGFPLRCMEAAWPKRAMQFTDLASGEVNLQRYTELLLHVGYQDRYTKLYKSETAPLVVEAESAHKELDFCSADGIRYVANNLCFPQAAGSFEEGMGA